MIIYKAENLINHKVYVGKTSNTLEYRQLGHFNAAKKGSKLVFHQAIRKYGIDCFKFSVLCKCSSLENLNRREKYFITSLDSMIPNGYNMTVGGDGQVKGWKSPTKGTHFHSEEAKAIIREKRALQIITEETKQKQSESLKKAYSEGRRKSWNKGLTKETNASIKSRSEKIKGIPTWNKGMVGFLKGKKAWNTGLTKETDTRLLKQAEKIKGRPSWNKGLTKDTDERVRKYAQSLSNTMMGHIPWNKGISYPQTEESNRKRSETMKGIPKSEETRLRMTEAQQLRRSQERMKEAVRGHLNVWFV